MELKLHSPVGAEPISYPWPGTERLNTEEEIKSTIKWVCNDFPELKLPLENNVLNKIEENNDYESMKALCDRFNRAVDAAASLRRGLHNSSSIASEDLLKHILLQVYVLSVLDPSELNQYEPFSPEVYGETSFDLISKMIEQINITEDDVFIDLGSGIGQVVLQMAAATKCKICIGIEKAEVPNKYSEAMNAQFKKWMAWFGKSYGKYELIKGDFLLEEHRKTIISASIVFVNNFAFGPTVDHQLKERFADLRDGARIVSSKSFCPLNFRITDRNLSDIGTIMHVSEMQPLQGSVSWTGNTVLFYLHVIDRTKLERYFQKLKSQPRGGRDSCSNGGSLDNTDNESSSRQFSQMSSSRNSDNTSDDESTDNSSPPRVTTRRAWSDYVKTKSCSDEESTTRTNSRPKRILPRTSKSLAVTPATMPAQKSTFTRSRRKPAKGRRTKPKRPIKISGLDLLHNETLLSTSPEKVGRKPPPAPGCVDQQLTSLTSSEGAVHEELEIPPAPNATPYGLQILINKLRDDYLAFFERMKQPSFKNDILIEIEKETKKKENLKKQIAQLDRQIKYLTEDSVAHLKTRVREIGLIQEEVTVDGIFKVAGEIVLQHKKLQSTQAKLTEQVNKLQEENARLVEERCMEFKMEKGITGPLSPEHIFEEIMSMREYRQKLMTNASVLTQEISLLEKQCYDHQQKRLIEQIRLEKAKAKAAERKELEKQRARPPKEEPRIGFTANKVCESPRFDNFEERLKNIITNALQEDSSRNLAPDLQKTSAKSNVMANQESPGKLALRRHLSQDKILPPPKMKKPRPRTIGDLVNVEIERSFEKDFGNKGSTNLAEMETPRPSNIVLQPPRIDPDPYEFNPHKFEIKEEPVEGLAASLHESIFHGDVKEEPLLEVKHELENLKRAVSEEDFFPHKRIELEGIPSPIEGEKWKDKVSSGFDRIVAFASTVENEKRRRSSEGGSSNSSPETEREGGKLPKPLPDRDTPPVLEPLQVIAPSPPPSSPLNLLPLDGPYSPVNKPTTHTTHNHFKKKFFQRNWKLQK